jgi:hypothetical protein
MNPPEHYVFCDELEAEGIYDSVEDEVLSVFIGGDIISEVRGKRYHYVQTVQTARR